MISITGPFSDRVKETTTTTGTGNITLAGAVSQFESFNTAFGTAVDFYYAIVGQSGTEWEVGWGVLSDATTLVRTIVLQSSNSDAAVDFAAGTKDVFVPIPGEFTNQIPTLGEAVANAAGYAMP